LLNGAINANCKTLPQYAMELWEILQSAAGSQMARREPCPPRWHLFGITQISALHTHTLRWLGRFFDFRVYHLNPLVGRLSGNVNRRSIERLVKSIARSAPVGVSAPGQELLAAWGSAGGEGLRLLSE